MEFRDSSYLISAKNNRKLKKGMVFNLALGFQDLEEDGKKFVHFPPYVSLDLIFC